MTDRPTVKELRALMERWAGQAIETGDGQYATGLWSCAYDLACLLIDSSAARQPDEEQSP